MLQLAIRALLDLCFPPRCVVCAAVRFEVGHAGLCRRCAIELPPPAQRCAACGREVGPHATGPRSPASPAIGPAGLLGLGCARCAGVHAERDPLAWSGTRAGAARRALRGVVAAWPYAGTARELVVGLKFRGRIEGGRALGEGLADAVLAARVPGDLIVPVPLSRPRRRSRGFNQAALLARAVARATGVQMSERALRRPRHGPPQSGRSRTARRRGPRGAFRAAPRLVGGRCVILVDDVLTSGATARACAVALRRAGAAAVTAAVACRAERR